MKIIVSRLELISLIGKIQAIVPLKPSLPVLGHILLEASGNQLTLSATDLTTSMQVFAQAQVLEPGAIALPARKFFQLIRELTSMQVEINAPTADIAHIQAGSSLFRISGIEKSKFPTLPDLSEGVHFSIDNALLKEMLVRSSFAAARDDNRQVLKGVLFQNLNKMATFIGTDGKRLAKLQTVIDSLDSSGGSYILPLKAVEEIIKLLDKEDERVKMTLMQDKISLELNAVILISKLLFGKYPDIEKVIPAKSPEPIIIHREELLSLLRQVSLFTADSTSAVKFSLSEGELNLSITNGDLGEGKASMIVNYGGPAFNIAFNPFSFIDILRHIKDETFQITLTDSYNPGLITDSTNAQFVIMPMRLDG